jgi:uncharacterized protein (UPF0335 family)
MATKPTSTVTITAPGQEPVVTSLAAMETVARTLRAKVQRVNKPPQTESSVAYLHAKIDASARLDATEDQPRFSGTERNEMNPQTAQQLKSIVERIERLEEEKKALAEDIKEVYSEAKGNGFDTKIIRKVVQIRKQETAERVEQEQLIDLYLTAVGTKD